MSYWNGWRLPKECAPGEGMIDMDSSIRKLFDEEKISARAAYDKAIDKEQFKNALEAEEKRSK